VYLILIASKTSSMKCTCKKLNANVLLLVAITEGQDVLIENPQVLENDNDTVMVKMHFE